MNINEARELLKEYITKESLIKHSEAVRIALEGYAEHFNEDKEAWGVVGLLHDIDYEKFEDTHPLESMNILSGKLTGDEITAIQGHSNVTGVKRETNLVKALYAVDTMSGFITAVALVRPSKKLFDVEIKSVKKKMKDKAFAAAVNREELENGATEMGLTIDEHIEIVLNALKKEADVLGL